MLKHRCSYCRKSYSIWAWSCQRCDAANPLRQKAALGGLIWLGLAAWVLYLYLKRYKFGL